MIVSTSPTVMPVGVLHSVSDSEIFIITFPRNGRYHPDDGRPFLFPEIMMWFMACLHAKINRNDKRQGRCYSQQYQDDLRHDVEIIRQAKQHRIRYSGSNILNTKELKKRYPDIDHYNPFYD